MRIAIGGIRHESNTFSTIKTRLEDFTIRRGIEVVEGPFWDQLRGEGVELAPTLSAGATPNGIVDQDAYLTLKEELLEQLSAQLPFDGIYLNLHGAMEVEGIGDGETDLLSSIRKIVGNDLPISIGLDLHGNLSPEFVSSADSLTALWTAPHRDGAQTQARAVSLLIKSIRDGKRPTTAMVKLPLLLPGENAVTDIEPSLSLYAMLEEISKRPGVWDASLMIACAWTDSPYTSVSTLVVAEEGETAQREAQEYADEVWEKRHEFGPEVETMSIDESIRRAMTVPAGTVFISDSGDNVTAGGAGDLPIFIRHLLAAKVPDVLVAGITDPEAVAKCVEAGIGSNLILELGGKLDHTNSKPLEISAKLLHLGQGTAVVRVQGVTIIIIDGRRPFHTFAAFEPSGIDPLRHRIVVVKQGYLSPDLREKAAETYMALSSGFTDLRLEGLPYRRIKRPIFPLDPL